MHSIKKNVGYPLDTTYDKLFLEHLLDGVDGLLFQFLYNPKNRTYTFPFVSGGMKNLYGFDPEELAIDGKAALNLVAKEDADLMRAAVIKSLKDLTPWEQDYRLILPSKEHIWLRGNARPQRLENGSTQWNGYIYNITEIKRVELELAKSKERYEFALEGSEIGVWDWDIKANKVFYSDKSLKIIGKTREEVDAHENTWNDLVHPDDRKKYYEDINNHFKNLTPYYSNHHRVLTDNGSYKWVQDLGKTVEWDENGDPLRVTGTHTDITKMKQSEEILMKKNALVENHNDRLKNFALIVSHNLRTHSGNLKDILRMIDEAETQEEKMELASYLHTISEGLSGTISNLDEVVLSQSRLGDSLKLISLRDSVNQILFNLKLNIDEKKVIVQNNIPDDILLKYNSAYLESILHNLISNAIKYNHPDRVLEITINVELVFTNDLILSVIDNGIGIDLDRYGSKLFGMYNTFHINDDAKGLGLFMTKNQIEDMGDAIQVESSLDKGSTFKVHFKNKLARV